MDNRDYLLNDYYVADFDHETGHCDSAPACTSEASSSVTIPPGFGTPWGSEGHELAELVWPTGPATSRMPPGELGSDCLPPPLSSSSSVVPKMEAASKLFEDDELSSWLQYFPDEAAAEGMLAGPRVVTSSQSTAAGLSSISTASTSVSPPELGAARAEHAVGSAVASSSSGGSGCTAGLSQKRKVAEPYDSDAPNEEFEEMDEKGLKKPPRRTRSAEVHNLSERKRRDKINEKMKALRELIPRCNKRDKASMLDDAIEYTKSLQFQLKMMSMGCNMVPVVYPPMQQYSAKSGAESQPRMVEQNSAYAGAPVLPFSPVFPGPAGYSGTSFSMQAYDPGAMVFTEIRSSENANQLNSAPDMVQPTQFPESSYHQYFSNRFPQVLNQAPSVQQNQPSKDDASESTKNCDSG